MEKVVGKKSFGRCEQNIIDKCAEMSGNLQQRMDELIASGSVAAVRKFFRLLISIDMNF